MLRRYVAGRVVAGLISLLVFLSGMFFLARWLIPGDISSNFAQSISGEQERSLQRILGLDRPLWAQYVTWMGNVLTFDLGSSGFGRPVALDVMRALPWTLTMFGLGIGLAFWLGAGIGRWAGWRKQATTPTTVSAAALTSLFPPWLIFFIFYFGLQLLGFRAFNRLSTLHIETWETGPRPFDVLWQMIATVAGLTGVSLLILLATGRKAWRRELAWVLRLAVPAGAIFLWHRLGILPRVVDLLGFLTMPVLALFTLMVGDIVLVVAASMDGLHEADFAVTARAKGLTNRQVRGRHAGRVAVLPALSRLIANLPFALGGLVIIEATFGRLGGYRVPIPGLASVMFGSLRQRNLLLTLGGLLVVGLITLVVRILLDLALVALDPRIRLGREQGA
jgi:peptide/nickel transport system permease protein